MSIQTTSLMYSAMEAANKPGFTSAHFDQSVHFLLSLRFHVVLYSFPKIPIVQCRWNKQKYSSALPGKI